MSEELLNNEVVSDGGKTVSKQSETEVSSPQVSSFLDPPETAAPVMPQQEQLVMQQEAAAVAAPQQVLQTQYQPNPQSQPALAPVDFRAGEVKTKTKKPPKTGAPSLCGMVLACGILAAYLTFVYMVPVKVESMTFEYLFLAAIAVVSSVLGIIFGPIAMGLGRTAAGHGRAMSGAGFVLAIASAAFLAFNIVSYWNVLWTALRA